MYKKRYTAKQMADLSGVSVRTLHYYEEINLLVPAREHNGYRTYSHEDARRLQQILLYRMCGIELRTIAQIIDASNFNANLALEEHLLTLFAKRKELDKLIETVQKTVASMKGETQMNDAELFEGLKKKAVEENEHRYGAEARKRYGDKAVDAANDKLLSMDKTEWGDKNELEEQIKVKLAEALISGEPESTEARELCMMHEQWIRMHWGVDAYSKDAHLGLARGYLQNPEFIRYYDDAAGPGATEFLVRALELHLQ